MNIVAFIPVRGGSKSIPRKNIKDFCGRPLVYWNIRALARSRYITRIVIATDSEEIKKTVTAFGLDKVRVYDREPENARDTSSTESVMLEYLSREGLEREDLFLLVQATSPLTRTEDIEGAIEMYREKKPDSIVSCVRNKRFFWNQNGTPLNYDYRNRPRRQDFEGLLMENGAFYINTVGNILDSGNRLSGRIEPYVMPEYTAVELDEEDDWVIAEKLMARHVLKRERSRVKVFLTDVDGVLTDAGMYYSETGDELKKFNTRDGKGFELLRKAGIKVGIITAEDTKIVEKRASKLQVDFLFQGVKDKLSVVRSICEKERINGDEVAYVGDDLNDLDVLKFVKNAFCPGNAVRAVRQVEGIRITQARGGEGVVREAADWILETLTPGPR